MKYVAILWIPLMFFAGCILGITLQRQDDVNTVANILQSSDHSMDGMIHNLEQANAMIDMCEGKYRKYNKE